MPTKEKVLNVITDYYLGSNDFNGIPIKKLCDKIGLGWIETLPLIKELINTGYIGILYPETTDNPHILRLGFQNISDQITKLESANGFNSILYPRRKHLENVVDKNCYKDSPYSLLMALGEPQLTFISFDLSVLEFYRNDPRYYYKCDDINGSIGTKEEFYKSDKMQDADKVLLSTFGFSYNEHFDRAVAVYLRYLANLSTEHQKIWKSKEIQKEIYKLHPDYFRNTIVGDWGSKVSIFSAFIKEIFIINRMCEAIGRPKLFSKEFGEYGDDKPKKFGFMLRPTSEEFYSFCLLLDQLMSDNINKKFFQNEVSYENEVIRKDGKLIVQQKGTIILLDEWMRQYFNFIDDKPWKATIDAFKAVRKLRQKPAHSISNNSFDQKYFHKQRDLIIKSYNAINIIRTLLGMHPEMEVGNINIPTWIVNKEVWTF